MILKARFVYSHHLLRYISTGSTGIDSAILAAAAVAMNIGNLLIVTLATLVRVSLTELERVSFDLRIPYVLCFLVAFAFFLANRRQYLRSEFVPRAKDHALIWTAAVYFVVTMVFYYFALLSVAGQAGRIGQATN